MLLANADFAIELPRPLPPNVKMVGPLMVQPTHPLPDDLEVGHKFAATFLLPAPLSKVVSVLVPVLVSVRLPPIQAALLLPPLSYSLIPPVRLFPSWTSPRDDGEWVRTARLFYHVSCRVLTVLSMLRYPSGKFRT
jgi:hypothetical protein